MFEDVTFDYDEDVVFIHHHQNVCEGECGG